MLTSPEFYLALGGTALVVAIVILRFIAPRTKSKKDDDALEKLEGVAEFTGTKLPPKADAQRTPLSQTEKAATVKPGPTVRDHR